MSETRTVHFSLDPALSAYFAHLDRTGQQFSFHGYDLFAAGYRAADAARLRVLTDDLQALVLSAIGGLFTDREQAYYDVLCDEIERLEGPKPAAHEVAAAGTPCLPGFDDAAPGSVAVGGKL